MFQRNYLYNPLDLNIYRNSLFKMKLLVYVIAPPLSPKDPIFDLHFNF